MTKPMKIRHPVESQPTVDALRRRSRRQKKGALR